MRNLSMLSLAVAATALRVASFANTNSQSGLYICTTPQEIDLDEAGFAALTYVKIGDMGELGETGTSQNILTYDTWAESVVRKAKGMRNAGDPDVETSRNPTDPGQIALRAAAKTNSNYAFKIERNDPATSGGTPTIIYNRGLVAGPKRPNGRNEDFDLEIYTLGFQQEEVVVDPT